MRRRYAAFQGVAFQGVSVLRRAIQVYTVSVLQDGFAWAVAGCDPLSDLGAAHAVREFYAERMPGVVLVIVPSVATLH